MHSRPEVPRPLCQNRAPGVKLPEAQVLGGLEKPLGSSTRSSRPGQAIFRARHIDHSTHECGRSAGGAFEQGLICRMLCGCSVKLSSND